MAWGDLRSDPPPNHSISDSEVLAVNCLVCGTPDKYKPMCFRKTEWCSDRHRKVVEGEEEPNAVEKASMNLELLVVWRERWDAAREAAEGLSALSGSDDE